MERSRLPDRSAIYVVIDMSLTPITEDDIATLTKYFYAHVRKDDILGPIFNNKIGTDKQAWDPHIAHINDFWSGIFLKTRRFDGNPMAKHAPLPGITPAHFTRWLELFSEAAAKTLPPAKQEAFNQTANRIAQSLQMGLAVHFAQNDDDTPNPFIEFGISRPSWMENGAPHKH